jgi:hypothetical protein
LRMSEKHHCRPIGRGDEGRLAGPLRASRGRHAGTILVGPGDIEAADGTRQPEAASPITQIDVDWRSEGRCRDVHVIQWTLVLQYARRDKTFCKSAVSSYFTAIYRDTQYG